MKEIKVSKVKIEVPKEAPKQFYIKYTKGGRNYYTNQSGKRVSAASVKKGRKKVYTALLSGTQKGALLEKKPKGSKYKKTKPKNNEGKYLRFQLLNVNVFSEFTYYEEKRFQIGVKGEGENYFILKSEKSKADFLLFMAEVNKVFFDTFKKLIEYPLFWIDLIENKTAKKVFFDFSEVTPHSKLKEIASEGGFKEFHLQVLELFNKYFK